VSIDEAQGNAIELLAELCERQAELSTAAHIAVMEAFNRCVEISPAPLVDGPGFLDPVESLLWRTAEALRQLSRATGTLGLYVTYATAQALVEQAISER
jgi:hypothetical protein